MALNEDHRKMSELTRGLADLLDREGAATLGDLAPEKLKLYLAEKAAKWGCTAQEVADALFAPPPLTVISREEEEEGDDA